MNKEENNLIIENINVIENIALEIYKVNINLRQILNLDEIQ